MKRSEGHFTGIKEAQLFYQTWTTPKAKSTMVLTHGMGEHSECYQRLADVLIENEINLIAWDLRGHGKSDGKRGFVDDFRDYVEDLKHFLIFLESSGKLDHDYYISAHSMGGLITLRYLLEYGHQKAKAVTLSSPLLGIAVPVPPIKDYASKILNKYLPSLTLHNEIKYELLTRDIQVIKEYNKDPFRHDKISSGVYLGMLENMQLVKNQAHQIIKCPFLLQVAGDDKIVSRKASEEFFKLVEEPSRKLFVYEEASHEIFNDICRDIVFTDLIHFLKGL